MSPFDVGDNLRTNPSQEGGNDGGTLSVSKWSQDPLQIPLGPVTRARAKRFQEALNGLIQDKFNEQGCMLASNVESSLVQVIQFNPNDLGHSCMATFA